MKSPTAANGSRRFPLFCFNMEAQLVSPNLFVILYLKKGIFYNDGKTRTTKKEDSKEHEEDKKIKQMNI
jgi:hypothetical protein